MAGTDYNTNKAYLRQLLQKAEEYNKSYYDGFDKVTLFYRNKPAEYFQEVKRNNNVIRKIQKDFNGDPKSPINGYLDGVFLGVTLFRGNLPTLSPFGNTRVHIPIEALFRESTNLYFTDFYCSTSTTHYVTLVLTPRSTSDDVFCQKNLLKLDPKNNSFLRMHSNAFSGLEFTTIQRPYLYVEVFYTENINLDHLLSIYGPEKVYFRNTGILGQGHSTPGGLRKNSSCNLCNPPVQIQYGSGDGGIHFNRRPIGTQGPARTPVYGIRPKPQPPVLPPVSRSRAVIPVSQEQSWPEWLYNTVQNTCTIL